MSKFQRFADEDEERAGADNTSNMLSIKDPSPDYSREIRNEKIDDKFRRSPIKTWLKMLFPHFELLSFSTLYALILAIVFVLQVLVWFTSRWTCVIYHMGACYTPAIHRWQIHRLVFPTLLHYDFPHLAWNIFVLAAVGMNAEHYLGTVGYICLIAVSALLGNMFTAGFRFGICNQSVGASVVMMGIIAFEFIWFAFNWKKMKIAKWLYILYLFMIFLTTMMGTWGSGYIYETWGLIGGFLAGACITCIFFTELQNVDFVQKFKFGFILALGVLFLISFIAMLMRDTRFCYPNLCNHRYYEYFN
ncbi:unnamed protein product [Moneuplotes crassus]|uniref:Rhomboid-like protease n=1 Tax=Euplotes crassus TaxID=5936 RepID=A0AAD1XMV3_EUPCR|nr:unnamed protein product [Moneuplotes crassus]